MYSDNTMCEIIYLCRWNKLSLSELTAHYVFSKSALNLRLFDGFQSDACTPDWKHQTQLNFPSKGGKSHCQHGKHLYIYQRTKQRRSSDTSRSRLTICWKLTYIISTFPCFFFLFLSTFYLNSSLSSMSTAFFISPPLYLSLCALPLFVLPQAQTYGTLLSAIVIHYHSCQWELKTHTVTCKKAL